jgi:hypothetical protein
MEVDLKRIELKASANTFTEGPYSLREESFSLATDSASR